MEAWLNKNMCVCGFGKACNVAHKYLETGVCTVSANVVEQVGGVVVVSIRAAGGCCVGSIARLSETDWRSVN